MTALKGAVLVTGGTGFIGRALIGQLLEAYPTLSLLSLSLPEEVVPKSWAGRVDSVAGNVTSASDVATAMRGVRCVIHLASLLGVGDYDRHLAITVGGTENVLSAARTEGARVIVVSSIAVYGEFVRDRICTESVDHGPYYDPYSYAKQLQEIVTRRYVREHAVDAVIVRPGNVVGAGSLPWVDAVSALLQFPAPVIVDEGEGCAGLIHVRDVATGLVALAESGKTGEAYNLAGSWDVTWRQYFGDIASMLGLSLPHSMSFDALQAAARQFEDPQNKIVPRDYKTIPLATLFLIGSDNRFPIEKIKATTQWRTEVSYVDTLNELKRYLNSA